MAKRPLLPVEAKQDVLTVCRFSTEQLQALVELFSSEESVPPFDLRFFEKAAERLLLDSDHTGSALSVATFLQNLGEQGFPATDVANNVRGSIEEWAESNEKQPMLAGFDRNRSIWESLIRPKPARIRVQKIRSLSRATQRTADEFRTICQLRPLFEDQVDGSETIAGHVLSVLLEVTVSPHKGGKEKLVFDLTPESLRSLKETIERADRKLKTIIEKYGAEILNAPAQEQSQ